jgi:hypothetical protein
MPEHKAMIRTRAFVWRIGNFECAGDISPLVNPSSVETRKDGPGSVKQLNVARFMLDKAASERIGTYQRIPYYHSAGIFGSVRTNEVARWLGSRTQSYTSASSSSSNCLLYSSV